MLVMIEQVYVVYLGHLPEQGSSSEFGGLSAVEAAHHDLLSQVLDDDRFLFITSVLLNYLHL
jgi:hypothetical protein